MMVERQVDQIKIQIFDWALPEGYDLDEWCENDWRGLHDAIVSDGTLVSEKIFDDTDHVELVFPDLQAPWPAATEEDRALLIDWVSAVDNNETLLGFRDWVNAQKGEEPCD